VVLPVAVLLVFGLIIGAIGVYRHHQMALVTREAARWASVHGTDYQAATHKAAATAQDVYEQAIKPKAVDLDLSKLTYEVTWEPDKKPGSTVTVTVRYQWIPEAVFTSATLSSTSKMRVVY
jgi:Flp pilus assembly protein TadG